nr:hypothetical protein [Tanacetum cinerariifolium]
SLIRTQLQLADANGIFDMPINDIFEGMRVIREPTPKRQPTLERPLSPPPSSPVTEWVVPDPVSHVADWRP